MQVRESIFRDALRLVVWFPLRWAIAALPIRAGLGVMAAMGGAHYMFSGGKARIAQALERRLGLAHKPALEAARRYFEIHYVDRLHIFLYPRLRTEEAVGRIVRFDNLEVLKRVHDGGRGALIVQPHFGPVQMTLLALSAAGFEPMQIGYPSDKGLSRIGRAVAFRNRLKYEALLPPILPADRYLGKAYKHLKSGGVVLTTGDGAGGGVFMGEHREFPFLGGRRPFPTGPAEWALRTGAAYIPTFVVPGEDGIFRVVFEDPIEPAGGDRAAESIAMTERFIAVLERRLRGMPQCWHFWDEA